MLGSFLSHGLSQEQLEAETMTQMFVYTHEKSCTELLVALTGCAHQNRGL